MSTAATPNNSKPLVGSMLVFELRCIRNLVKCDIGSESDAKVIVSLVAGNTSSAKTIAGTCAVTFPTIDDDANPQWLQAKWIAALVPAGSFVKLRLLDEDQVSDDLIAEVYLPVEQLALDKSITLKLPYVKDAKKIQEMDILLRDMAPLIDAANKGTLRKRIFTCRHAESQWNDAQKQKAFGTMLRRVDHPLTPVGSAQALILSKKIKNELEQREAAAKAEAAGETQAALPPAVSGGEAVKAAKKAALDAFLTAPVVYASPLCRALQTALLALHPLSGQDWVLRKNAREKRNFGGRDSSGTCFGEKEYLEFIVKELTSLNSNYLSGEIAGLSAPPPPFPPMETLANILGKTDTTEVRTKWWVDSKEDSEEASERISDLVFEQILFDPRDTIICVGHSHYFRDLFKIYFSDALREKIKQDGGRDGFTLEQWCGGVWKLENCGVACLELDFAPVVQAWAQARPASLQDLKCVVDAHLMLDSKLIP